MHDATHRATVTGITADELARYKHLDVTHGDVWRAGLAALESGPATSTAAPAAPVVIEVGPDLAALLRALARDGGQHERPAAPAPADAMTTALVRAARRAERLDGQHRALWDAYAARDRIAVADVRAVLGCGWTTASRIMGGLVVSGRASAHPKPMGGAWTWTLRPPDGGPPADG